MQTPLPTPARQGRRERVRPMDAAAVDHHEHWLPWQRSPRGMPLGMPRGVPGRPKNPSERMGTMARYAEDIRMTGSDIHQCSPSPEHPRLQRISLTLSGLPPSEWQTMFTRECRVARQTLWREARIEGSYIVIDCVPEELEQPHLDSVKEDVKNTKKKFGLLMAQRQEEATRQWQAEHTARQR